MHQIKLATTAWAWPEAQVVDDQQNMANRAKDKGRIKEAAPGVAMAMRSTDGEPPP